MSTGYLIRNVSILGARADRPGAPRRRDLGRGRRRRGVEEVDGTGLIALPGLVDLHTHLREPGREDAETVESGTRAAAMGGFTAVHAMANTDPVADTAGRRRAGLAARPRGRLLRRLPGRRGHRRPGRRAAGRARRDGRLRRPGPGLLRRRQVRQRRGADAPGAGVRQGVRRRRRPARPGAPAHRERADERGRAVRAARPRRLARGRRGGDHRPRLPARGARRVAAARLPRLDRRLGRDRPRRQAQGLERHRRGLPAPPAADRRARGDLRPDLQGQPAAALGRRHRGAPRGAGRRHHRHRRHRPRAAPARGQGLRVGGGRVRDARPGDRAVDRAGRPWSTPACSTGPASPSGCPTPRRGSAGSPTTAGRSRRGRRPTSCSTTPRRGAPSRRRSRRRCRATRRTPAWSCPAGWSPRSCAARPTVLDGKLQ